MINSKTQQRHDKIGAPLGLMVNILEVGMPTALYEIWSVSLFPNPAWNGFLAAGNRARTSSRHLSIACGTGLWQACTSRAQFDGLCKLSAAVQRTLLPDLELVWPFLDHLSIQGRHQTIRRDDHRPQRQSVLVYVEALEVVPREASLPD